MNLLTVIVLAYLVFMAANAARKGFLRSIVSMMFLAVVVFLTLVLTPSVRKVFQESEYVTDYVTRQSAAVIASVGYGEGEIPDISSAHTPSEVARAVIATAVQASSASDQGADAIAQVIINSIAGAVTFAIAFVIALILRIAVLGRFMKEGAGIADHLLGMPIGLIRGFITVWIVLGFIQLLSFTRPFTSLAAQISASPILSWIAENNLLAAVLAKLVTQGISS